MASNFRVSNFEEVLKKALRSWGPMKDNYNEPYSIIWFNPNNSEQTQRFADIDRHSEVLKWMVPHKPALPEDLDKLIRSTPKDPVDPRLMFGIADRQGNVVGWVQYYPIDKKTRLEQLKKQQVKIPEDSLILETSYAKLFGSSPKDKFAVHRVGLPTGGLPGVAVNGLKQTLKIVSEMERQISKAINQTPRHLLIVAYTNPSNIASESVLKRNGFQLLTKNVKYDGETSHAWIKRI